MAARALAVVPASIRAIVLASALVAGGPLAAQPAAEPESTGDAADEDASRRVDESEENFRRRMELREQRFRDRPRSNTTFSYSTRREGKLANLPPESQQHVREQLRDLVIESRLWEPGEDVSDYPYEPSPAGKGDPQLARQEREAFVEELQQFQQREAAAAARAAGGPGSDGADDRSGSAGGRSAATQPVAQPATQAATQAGEVAGTEAGPAPVADTAAGPGSGETAPISNAGVSESALDFLRQQGLAGPGPVAGASPGNMPGEAQGEGQGDSTGQPSNDAAAAPPGASSAGSPDAPPGETAAAAAAPAGTVDIDALQALDAALAGDAGQGGAPSAGTPSAEGRSRPAGQDEDDPSLTLREVNTPEPEPGTLDIESLRRLDAYSPRAGTAVPPKDGDEP